MLARFLYLLHIPDTKGGSAQLCPYLAPAVIPGRLIAVWLALNSADKGTREVYFVCMSGGQLNDGADFGVKGNRYGGRLRYR